MDAEQLEDEEYIMLRDLMATMADRLGRQDTLRTQIEKVHKILVSRLVGGGSRLSQMIVQILFMCGINLPYKAPMYATLAGLLTSTTELSGRDIASGLAEKIVKEFSMSLRNGHASTARRALRYLVCLSNISVVSSVSVAEYIYSLLDAAHFEMTAASRSEYGVHCRGQFLADIGLSALPWCSKYLSDRCTAEMTKIDSLVQQIATIWRPNVWRSIMPSVDHRCTEEFSDLLEAISELRENNWSCDLDIIPTPYDAFKAELNIEHEVYLPALSIPGHSKITLYSAPSFNLLLVNFRPERRSGAPISTLQSSQDAVLESTSEVVCSTTRSGTVSKGDSFEAKPNNSHLHSIERHDSHITKSESLDANTMDTASNPNSDTNDEGAMPKEAKVTHTLSNVSHETSLDKIAEQAPLTNYVIRNYIKDIADNFSSRHLMATERLLNLPMLNDDNGGIVECLFSQLCAFPTPAFSLVYYGTLFADLCRVKDSRLPAKLLVAVQTIFQHADEFDPEAFDRLADWFSFHLSNFGYKWNWQEWSVYADAEMVDKFPYRALFCKDVIARCVRLSYYDRMKNFLPSEMKVFLPPQPNEGNRSRFDDRINADLMKIVTGKGRLKWSEVKERLIQLIPPQSSVSMMDDMSQSVDIDNLRRLSALVRAILQAGCRTLSHFDIVVERYMELLRQLSANGGQIARQVITAEVNCFWENVHIRRLYVLDKLAQYRIIDHFSILDSCLSTCRTEVDFQLVPFTDHELKLKLSQSSCWEIIRLTMSRARAREDGSRKELALASQAAASANEGDLEEAEKRLGCAKQTTEEAKREIRELLIEALRRLFSIIYRLLESSDDSAEIDENSWNKVDRSVDDRLRLPGFPVKPIWFWRCTGMIRELARMQSQHLSYIIQDLDSYTKEMREKHNVLWESFDIVRELEKCSMHVAVF